MLNELFKDFCKYDYMNKEEQIEFNHKICNIAPFLIPKNRWTSEALNDYDYSYTELDIAEVPRGWRYLCFLEALDIAEQLKKENRLDKFLITQWKEKYNQLRLYNIGSSEEIRHIIYAYEIIASYVCNICGKLDCQESKGYWIYSQCKECFEKNEYNKDVKYEDEFNLEEDRTIPVSLNVTIYRDGCDKKYTYDIRNTVANIREAYELWKQINKE